MTPTTEVEQAVERLRRVNSGESELNVYSAHVGAEINAMEFDRIRVIDAYLRETDTTPVDSDWLLSVCEQEADGFDGEPHYSMSGYHTDTELQIIVSPVGDGYELRLDPYKLANPTRGMVVSLCRLFGVTVEVKP